MSFSLRRAALSGAVALTGLLPAALVAGAPVVGPSPAAAVAAPCPAYFFYAVRGSNETPGTTFGAPNTPGADAPMGVNGMGDPIGHTYSALQAALPSTSFFAEADGYPALLQVSAVYTLGATYEASMNKGVVDAVADLNAEHALCPSARIIAAGYSQGADVIRRAINPNVAYPVGSTTPYPRLNFTPAAGQIFLLLFGDPNFHPETGPITTGGGSTRYTGIGIAATALGMEPATPAIPAAWHTESICHWADVVCQFSLGSGTSSHLTYDDSATSGAWRIIQFFGLQSATVAPVTARMRGVTCTFPGSNQANVTLTDTDTSTGASVTFTSTFIDDFGYTQTTTTTTVAAGKTVQLALHLPNPLTSTLQVSSSNDSTGPLEIQLLTTAC
jgi:hypothetical protein